MLIDSNVIIYKMTLGDSLIAATALVHNLSLVTHNKKDFLWIPNLTVLDPFKELPLNKSNN